MNIALHITHEAVQKIGGIGSVITGLCTADSYKAFFKKTLLYGPLFSYSADLFSRLGKGGEVLYSSREGYDAGNFHKTFSEIAKKHSIDIVYGKRMLVSEFDINKKNSVETLLVSVNQMSIERVNAFKYQLWERFGIESDRYSDWDYEQYLRIAVPYPELARALYHGSGVCFHFAHEYMGVPAALAVLVKSGCSEHQRTIFYAHEVSPARALVENSAGHDIAFYNIMRENRKRGRTFEDEYGSRRDSYRAELVKRTAAFDCVFAVSDLIKEEYLYFVKGADEKKIRVVHNGIPIRHVTASEKMKSRNNLQNYISHLFNFTPDFIFTHVTRLVESKGIWRDITFLYILDELFHEHGIKGAYILLSSLIGTGREPSAIASMEREYGWPVIHRDGWPDLVGAESDIYSYLSLFNARSRNIKGVFLNQFGFGRRKCGERVPEEADFIDLRMGSDAEFGFSIYEPFGIAQIEVVPFGGIAALSSACGCAGFLRKCFSGGRPYEQSILPFHVFDFINRAGGKLTSQNLLEMTADQRFEMERQLFRKEGKAFFKLLPKSDRERKNSLSRIMEKLDCLGWESIVDAMNLSTL